MMTPDFFKKAGSLPDGDFAKLAKSCMNELLGESISLAIVYHLGGSDVLHNPKVFESKLQNTFGPGADTILNYIYRNLETKQP